MTVKNGSFVSFGAGDEILYGFAATGENEEQDVCILPECLMRIKLSCIEPVSVSDDLPIEVMESFLRFWDTNGAIDNADDCVLSLYHDFAELLSDMDNPVGLVSKAYGCYGGYNTFPCDWEASRDCLLKLVELDYKPFYADTLGYIYYYGRCNNGVPQYAEAYKYFSMAAFSGNYEATYKIADMFFRGYYVKQDINTAIEIVRRLYSENLPFIMRGEFLSAFADIALRMGNMLREVLDMRSGANARDVYRYLLQADFAIRMRMDAYEENYGDERVRKNIAKALREVRDICHALPDWEDGFIFTIGLAAMCAPEGLLEMHVEHGESTVIRLKSVYNEREGVLPRFLLTVPDWDYCGLCDEMVFRVARPEGTIPEGDFSIDAIEGHGLYFRNQLVMNIDAGLELVEPDIEHERVLTLVSVRRSANSEMEDYIFQGESVRIGDRVLIPTSSGKLGTRVLRVRKKKVSELARAVAMYEQAVPLKEKR